MDEFEEFRCRAFSAGRAPIGGERQFNESGTDTVRSRIQEKRNRQADNANGNNSADRLKKGMQELTLDPTPRACSPTPKSPLAEGFNQQWTPKLHRARPSSLRCNRPTHKANGSLSPGLGGAHHRRSQSCRRTRRTLHPELNLDNEDSDGMRPRTASMPSKGNHVRRPQSLKVRPTHSQGQTPVEGGAQDPCPFYRVRSFTSSSKGIVNRGDSFKRKKRLATSDASVDSIDSTGDRLRHTWSTQSQGSRGSSVSSTVDADVPASHRVVILGATGVGKTAVVQQFKTSDYMGNVDTGTGHGKYSLLAVRITNTA